MLGGRRLYAAVLGLYAVSRVAFYVLGVRFSARYDWQFFHDPDLLKDRLWESLLYTHAFTPFMNLLAGTVLKISEPHAVTIYAAFHAALGCAFALSVAYAMDVLQIRRGVILAATVLFFCSPPFVYFEQLLLYEFPAAALLAVSVVSLHVALTRERFRDWLAFFLVCAAVAWIRTTFHLVWLLAVVVLAIAFRPERFRVVLVSAAVPLLLVVGLYAKNLHLFGVFGASSWVGFNLATVTTERMAADERTQWIAQGRLHPVAGIPLFSGPEAYARHVDLERTTGIPVLDRQRRSNGQPNYNHWSYPTISKLRVGASRSYLGAYPRRYGYTVLKNAVDYFKPTSRWHPRDPTGSPHAANRAVLEPWEDLYNAAFHRFPIAPIGLYLPMMLALLYAVAGALRSAWKKRGVDCVREQVLLFMAFNSVYVSALSCLVSFGELERYRFMVDGFIWTLGLSAVPLLRVRAIAAPATGGGVGVAGAAACVCALLAQPAGAHAQQAVWTASPVEQVEPWFDQVRDALESQGVVVSESNAAAVECSTAIARDAARARGASYGLCVAVERSAASPAAVTIDLARADGAAGEGRGHAEGDDVGRAASEAYRRAELALELGGAGLLRVRTTPEGALVEVDGEPAGHAPFEQRAEPGRHRVAVTLDGFASERREIEVVRGRAVELAVQLERTAPVRTQARGQPSPLNFIVGGALLVGAAPALALGLAALARDGDCVDRDDSGVCSERVHFGTRSAVLIGAGAVALAAGVFFVLAAPIEIEAQASADGARLAMRARF